MSYYAEYQLIHQKAVLQAHSNHSHLMSLSLCDCIISQDDTEQLICALLCTSTICKTYLVQTDVHAILMKTVAMMSEAAESGAGVSQAPQ